LADLEISMFQYNHSDRSS